MAFNFRNKAGATGKMGGGHWAVFLTLAQSYGWKPEGTKAPANLPASEQWGGRYDTSDGQTVTDSDARKLAEVLHAAALSDTLGVALNDVIRHVEKLLEAAGITIPESMRMAPEHFHGEFSPLVRFLSEGEFVIE